MPSPSRPQTVVALALLAATFAQAQQPLRTRAQRRDGADQVHGRAANQRGRHRR